MIAGHFGLAAGVKARAKAIPLWALMLATAWLDVVFVPLLLTGVERVEPAPGTVGGYGALIIHADYTHSLVGALVLSALFGLAGGWRWGRAAGTALAAVVFSHWLLDLVVHRGDMPILPGDWGHLPRLGFGLWRVPLASMLAELALVIGGALLYWRAARGVQRAAGGHRFGRADLAGAIVLLSGLIVLFLDFTGIAG